VEALRRQVAALRRRTGALTAEERRARIEELRLRVPELLNARDGPGLVALMRELTRLGPEAYPAALEIASLFIDAPAGTKDVCGISVAWFRRFAFAGPASAMLRWAIELPDLAPPGFRRFAAERLALERGWWPGRKDWLLARLRVEDDDALARVLAERIGDMASDEDAAILSEIARRADGPGARAGAAGAIARLDVLVSRAELQSLTIGTDWEVVKEAQLWLERTARPSGGTRLVDVAPGSRAEMLGLKPGDVLLHDKNGKPVDLGKSGKRGVHTEWIEVVRGGATIRMRFPREIWSMDAPWGGIGRPWWDEVKK
jgi:hypothetical protein